MRRIIYLVFLALFASAGHAQGFVSTLITDPSLVGKAAGNDGLWGGTNPDLTLPGFNTIGAASGFGFTSSLTDNTFGFWEGTLDSFVTFPNSEVTHVNFTGEASCTICGVNFTNAPISGALALGGPYTTTITSAGAAQFNTFNSALTTVVSGIVDETVQSNTINIGGIDFGVILFNGQNPEDQFAGNQAVIDHFNFLLPFAPPGWVSLQTDLQFIEILDGFREGLSGTQSVSSFSVAAPVPVPAAFPMLLGGLLLLYRKMRTA